jgi:hypothetical protein
MEQDKGYNQEKKQKVSFNQRWREVQPTKTVLFWTCVAAVVLTMIIGFWWGGWMTGGTARKMAEKMAEEAVIKRLAPICVDQFNQDLGKEQKLTELKEKSNWSRGDYVQEQGWATMPGEENPDRQVATECANLLMQQISQNISSPSTESTSLLR